LPKNVRLKDLLSEKFNEKDINIFGVGTSIEESSCALVIKDLFLFTILPIFIITCDDPLVWWCVNEAQFPNVMFLVKSFFWHLGSQIETK
jgi:hypothetical protein